MPRSNSRTRGVTLADVARHAGVSTAVVSYVVNNGPRPVAEDTARRVKDAIAILGYRPNTQARALSTGTTGILGVIHPGTANPFFGEYSDVIHETAARAQVALITASSGGAADAEHELIESLAGRNVDGIVSMTSMTRSDVSRLPSPGVPVLFVNCPFPIAGHRTIGPNAQDGARRIVDHLLDTHGHRQVALIAGETGSPEPEEREFGWVVAHRERGAAPGPMVRTLFTLDGGYDGVRTLLNRADRPTAIFVASDLQAIGALHAIQEGGLRVPDDVAVVSFDGIAASAHTWPPLSVVRQPIRAMASAAIDAILSGATPAHTLIDTDVIIRSSCGCTPRKARLPPDDP